MIALKGVVAFPDMPVTCDIGKESSKRAIKEALETGEQIFLTTQKNLSVISPTINDISLVGTICDIRQAIKSGADVIKLLAHGSKRAIIKRIIEEMPYFLVEVEEAQVFNVDTVVTKALFVNAKERFLQYASIDNKISGDVLAFINSIENANMFIDSVAALVIKHEKKQLEILEEFDTENRLKKLINFLIEETEVAKINKKINSNIRTNMDKAQKDYYLREQMKAISAELGDEEDEYAVLEQKINKFKNAKRGKRKIIKRIITR